MKDEIWVKVKNLYWKTMVKDVGDLTPEEAIRQAQGRIKYNTTEYALETLVQRCTREPPQARPEIDFPRTWEATWTDEEQSRFIESILMGVPMHNIVLADVDDTAQLEIVDGKQRLNAILQFSWNVRTLCGLKILKELNGLRYTDLHPPRRLRFRRTTFRVVILDPSVDEEMREEIWERLGSH